MADGSRGNDALRFCVFVAAFAGCLIAFFISVPLSWDSAKNIPVMTFVAFGASVGAGVAAITALRALEDNR